MHIAVDTSSKKAYKDMSDKWANKYNPPQQSAKGGKGTTPQGGIAGSAKGNRGTMNPTDPGTGTPGPGQNTAGQQGVGNTQPPPQTTAQSSWQPPQFQSYYDPMSGTMKYSPMTKKFSGARRHGASGNSNNNPSSFKMKGFKAFDK